MKKTFVTWDLGATKCTAGIVEFDEFTQELVCIKSFSVKLADTLSLHNLISQLETGLEYKMQHADAICVGAAGQYDGEQLDLEGIYPYPMNFAAVARSLNWPPFEVIHDYASIVCATFTSYMRNPANIKRLNNCELNPYGRRVAFGIGTGLGLKDGVLFRNGDFWFGKNEIGHIGVVNPPLAEKNHQIRHQEFMRFLQQQYQATDPTFQITFEKILSGLGVLRLFKFFYPDSVESTPEEVGLKMREGQITEMLDAFAWYIGLFVGTVQLTFMPEGGIWITGGVSLHNLEVFDRPDFFAGINASPAYKMQRDEYALGLMVNLEHALIGSAYYATRRLIDRPHFEAAVR